MVRENMINELRNFILGKQNEEGLLKVEELIDSSYVKIQQYLLKLGQRDLTSKQSNEEVKLLNILNDIEHIGDMVVRLIRKAKQAGDKSIALDNRDQEKLMELLEYIERTYNKSLTAFKQDDKKLARKNIQLQAEINQFEKDVKFEHFNSLINKQEYNPDISAVYLRSEERRVGKECIYRRKRRRHTRWPRDWSSDVCSSDLIGIH